QATLLAGGIRAVVAAFLGAVGIGVGVAALVAGIAALVKLGSDAEKDPKTAAAREQLRKDRGGGLGPSTLRTYDSEGSGIDDRTGLPFAAPMGRVPAV